MKVSIVIPTFNRPELLRRLLDSIRRQTFRDYEVIVVDDGSPDQAAYRKLLGDFKGKFKRLSYLRTRGRQGAPHARNLGIRRARHPWIALVDDDDEWLPEKLRLQAELARRKGDGTGFLYTWAVARDEKGRTLHRYDRRVEGDGLSAILGDNFVPSPSVLARKDCLVRAGLFDESLPSCQDWDMWIRLFASGCRCAVVPRVLCIYHKHSVTIGNNPRAYRGYLRLAAKHFPLFLAHRPVTLLKVLWASVRLRFR